jgi:polysaccharide biosynthesis transport protein
MNPAHSNWNGGAENQHPNAFLIIHRLLRGKYALAITLGLIFGFIGGVGGYLSREPLYRSTGLIRIQPSLPKLLFATEQSSGSNTRLFSSFVNTQASLISNSDVILKAKGSTEWKDVQSYTEVDSVEDVQEKLIVRPDRSSQQIIMVSFDDPDPRVSMVLVSEILKAYIFYYGDEGSIDNPQIRSLLTDRQNRLENDRRQSVARITEITQKYQTGDLYSLLDINQLTVRQLESDKADLLNIKEKYSSFRAESTDDDDVVFTAEQAANFDPVISELIGRKRDLSDARDEMMVSEGLRAEHRDVRRITAMIQNIDTKIDERLENIQSGDESTTTIATDINGNTVPSIGEIESELQRYDQRITKLKAESTDLFQDNIDLSTERKNLETIESSLAVVSNRLDQIVMESQVEDMDRIGEKISIVSNPRLASQPTSDPRKKMAAVGFVGVGSLPVFAILGIGFFSHRVKYSDDDILLSAGGGIIGLLPDLGSSVLDNELATASAFAIHQIRTQLQIANTVREPRVYGVTSPAPQDGKTSLIIALGLSFAESGSKTLLVDLDFIGRGLSVHFGYPNAPSLANSLDTPESFQSHICQTDYDNLDILPAGFGDDELVSKLSPRVIGEQIQCLREKYDTVLIDSGPILGSVEAAIMAPQSDGMILVIGRGQFKPLVKKAVDQIQGVGGKIVATIFNRASVHELKQSSSSMSVHFSRQVSRQQESLQSRPNMRVGPVAGALFHSSANKQNTESTKGSES